MTYAIVDIETTGGYAANNDITELAIVLHDGTHVLESFQTLVNPGTPIPYYIQVLTGITPEMVATAPTFKDIAPRVFEMLTGKVFIAHNVNFDYSFLKFHLSEVGYDLHCQRVCTVRLSKKVFPLLPSYSLGSICRQLGITIQNRHRAGGDLTATVQLFEQILRHNGLFYIQQFLRRGSKEQCLPLNLAKEQIDNLPYSPGVYYFHNEKGKIIYVGKAKNIKYRVTSHFTHNGPGRQRQDFLRNIHSISYQSCSTELMAFILESIEIKRLWPRYNSSLKRFTPAFGLYLYEDRNGYLRFAIDKKNRSLQALYTFNLLVEGHRLLNKLINEFELCPKLCFIQTGDDRCVGVRNNSCRGACEQVESPEDYNSRFSKALEYLENMLPTFAVVDEGKNSSEQSCILIEKGRFYGMGYFPASSPISSPGDLKNYLQPYPENDYIRGLVYTYVEKRPEKKMIW